MACSLSPVVPRVKYEAKVGSQVTVDVEAAQSVGAKIVRIAYDAQSDNEPPFQFNVKKDDRLLTVVVTALKPNAMIRVVEACGDDTVEILKYRYKPAQDPRSVIIKGV